MADQQGLPVMLGKPDDESNVSLGFWLLPAYEAVCAFEISELCHAGAQVDEQ